MSTIIIPLIFDRTVNCIVKDGIKYCEQSNIAPKEFGFIVIVITIWFLIILYFVDKSFENSLYSPIALFAFLLPFIVMLFL
jgi:hypothetical protein